MKSWVASISACLAAATAGALLPGTISTALAQSYPSRPVSIVVPFAPGGPTDIIARTMAEHMRTSLGQSVTVENVAGANGNIGVGKVARHAGWPLAHHWPLEHACGQWRGLSAHL